MEKETIIYKGRKYNRYPNSKRRHLRVYYWCHDKWKEPPRTLHRDIWKETYGDIPKGFVIHHKDGNTLNNNIENLEILTNAQHDFIAALFGKIDAPISVSRASVIGGEGARRGMIEEYIFTNMMEGWVPWK